MTRKNIKHYAGASGRIKPEALAKLGPAYAIQPKHDGAYCHIHLGPTGCIQRIRSRTGRDYTGDQVEGLIGQFVGYPGAVLAGELTAHTEAGNREASEIGRRRVHVFDMLWGMETAPLHHLAYSTRRDELWRMQAAVDAYGPGQSWGHTEHGARSRKTGRYCRPRLSGTQLTPIVEQVRPAASGELWDRVQAGELEGLVAVSLAAPAGRRGAKRKCKRTETLDTVVLGVDARTVACLHGAQVFAVNRATRNIQRGDVLEVAHDGWYGTGLPRFPRIVRVRQDLMVDD